MVVFLEAALQSAQDFHGFADAGLGNVDFLESARQRPVLFKNTAKFLERGRANAAQFAGSQDRFDQVRGIHHAARGCAGPDDRVYFIDEENRVRDILQFPDHCFQALLEITAVLGAGQQRTKIQCVNVRILEYFRYFLVHDSPGQAFRHRCFPDTGLTDEQGLFLRRRHNTCTVLWISFSRPMSGSIRSSRARWLRSVVNCSSALDFFSDRPLPPLPAPMDPDFTRRIPFEFADAVGNIVDHIQPGDVIAV